MAMLSYFSYISFAAASVTAQGTINWGPPVRNTWRVLPQIFPPTNLGEGMTALARSAVGLSSN